MHEALRKGALQEEWLTCCCAGALLRGVWIQLPALNSIRSRVRREGGLGCGPLCRFASRPHSNTRGCSLLRTRLTDHSHRCIRLVHVGAQVKPRTGRRQKGRHCQGHYCHGQPPRVFRVVALTAPPQPSAKIADVNSAIFAALAIWRRSRDLRPQLV
jgi:hypothetical protein